MEQYENGVKADNGSTLTDRGAAPDLPEMRGEMSEPMALHAPRTPTMSPTHGRSIPTEAGGFFKNVASSIARNPLPLAMIAGGVGYYVYNELQSRKPSGSQPTTMSERVDASLTDEAASGARGAVSRVRELAHDVGEGVGAAAGRVSQAARDLSENASHLSSQAVSIVNKGQDMLLDRPLVIAGLGLALGAAIASAAPMTRREQDLMAGPAGEAIDNLVHGAQNLKERAKDSVGVIGNTVKTEASVLMSSTEQVGDKADRDDSPSDQKSDRS